MEEKKYTKEKKRTFQMFWALGGTVLLICVLISLDVPKNIIAFVTIVLGLLSQAFAGFIALITMIPILGPFLIKLFSIPLIWIINSIGSFVSIIAIKKGYKVQVINYRVLSFILFFGILLGYIIGQFFPIKN